MTDRNDLIPVLAAPMIDPAAGRVDLTVAAGATVEEIVHAALPALPGSERGQLRVALVTEKGAAVVPAERWRRVRPRPGVHVVIRLVPAKNVFRTVLQIVVAIAAIALGQWWAGSVLGLTAGTASYGIASGLFGLGVSILGNLLINALVPPAKPSNLEAENRYSITGWRNSLDPGGAVPLPLGTMRFAPPFGAVSYTEIAGGWQYIHFLFVLGYGELEVSDIRIGDTDIDEYDEVELEVRTGVSSDAPVTHYPSQVVEESVNVELLKPFPRDDLGEIVSGSTAEEDPVVRTTGADASGASVIVGWPSGLVKYTDDGKARSHSVSVRIEQRWIGGETWQHVKTLAVTASKLEAFYRQHSWTFPTRGRWQVRLTMLTDETTSTQIQQRTYWAALQTLRPEYPIDFPKPLALIAGRIKATYQLNGQLDELNCLVRRRCLDYDRSARSWTRRATRNPASLYRYVLQSPANPKPEPDSGIDLAALAEWHEFCRRKGLEYDAVLTSTSTTLLDVLTEIAAAGRAIPRHDGQRWTVTVDRPDKLIVDHISPRNSYNFRASRTYANPPDGWRIEFRDRTNDYKSAEMIVPWPGKEDADIALTEKLEVPGKTNPREIYREGRRRAFETLYRPDVFSVSQDGPARVATRGDRVRLSSDVIARTQIAARVTGVAGRLLAIDEEVTMEEGRSYAIRFRDGLSGNDTIGQSVVRTVTTVAGSSKALTIMGTGSLPGAGDLIHFGEAASLDYDLVVTRVEAGEDFSSHMRLVALAPEIDEIVDAEPIPEWSGRAGAEIAPVVLVPLAPRFTSIKSGIAGTGVAGRIDYLIRPGTGSATVAQYEIDHRLSGASSWTTITIAAADGGGSITGYAQGDAVELQARALSAAGTSGPATAVVTLTIGAGDAAAPAALPSGTGQISVGPLLGGAVVQFVTGADANTEQVRVWRGLSADFADAAPAATVAVEPSRSYSVPLGDTTRQTLIVNGDFGASEGWNATGWTIAGGVAGTVGNGSWSLWQSVSVAAGETIRYGFTIVSGSGGTVRARLATSGWSPFNDGPGRSDVGTFTGAITATAARTSVGLLSSEGWAGSVDDVYAYRQTATCLAQGVHYIWLEPLNADGVAGPRSGPYTVNVR